MGSIDNILILSSM